MLRGKYPLVAGLLLASLAAADWPRFRGPHGSGISAEQALPTKWSATENIVYRTALPGPGASSPVTFGDRVYVTCYSGYGVDANNPGDQKDLVRHLVCLAQADGRIVWDQTVPAALPEKEFQGFVALHGYASSTPAVDETGIYVFYGRTGAAAYDHQGQQLWLTELGSGTHSFGTANSPVLYGDLVLINASVESGDLVALEKRSGRVAWRTAGMKRSWNTPVLVAVQGGHELVVNTEGKLLALDPASGELLWECDAFDDYICPSPVAHDGIVYAIGSRAGTAAAVRAGGRGDVTETHKLWEVRQGSNVSSPVFHDGHLYFASESRGVVYCLDAKTGETVYEQRLDPRPGLVYASPVAADGKLYYVSREKGMYVLPAAPKFELLAHNVIASDESVFNGSPAVVVGRILLRSNTHLYSIAAP